VIFKYWFDCNSNYIDFYIFYVFNISCKQKLNKNKKIDKFVEKIYFLDFFILNIYTKMEVKNWFLAITFMSFQNPNNSHIYE